jgi:hypothetical protein
VAKTDQTEIEAARVALRRAANDQSFGRKRPMSKTEKIRELRVDIAKLRTQGRTWQDIAHTLEGTLDASADTIRHAIGTKKKPSSLARAKDAPAGAPSRSLGDVSEAEDKPNIPSREPASKKKRFGPPDL